MERIPFQGTFKGTDSILLNGDPNDWNFLSQMMKHGLPWHAIMKTLPMVTNS